MRIKIAIYPGSFDPLHEGHVEIIAKGLKLFDIIYVIVSVNPDKKSQRPIEERFEEASLILRDWERVKVIMNKDDFIANIAKELGADFLIRSARNNKDFNYEMELAAGNNILNKDLETILIIPKHEYVNYSSTLLRHKKKLRKRPKNNV